MSKQRKHEQKHIASRPAGTKFVRAIRPFAGTQTMHIDLNGGAVQIKENSP